MSIPSRRLEKKFGRIDALHEGRLAASRVAASAHKLTERRRAVACYFGVSTSRIVKVTRSGLPARGWL
jgi:hypothetical protein